MSNQSSPRSNVKTVISVLLSYLLLTSQLTPVAFALNRKSATGGSKEASQTQETASTASTARTKASRENASLNPPVPQPAPEPLLAPAIVATMDDGLPAATTVPPGGTINYTVNIRNNGVASPADDAANVVFSNTIDLHTTLVAGSAMAAVSDRYNTIGNVQISVPDGPTDLLGNDFNLATGNNTGMTVTAETKSSTQCAGCNNVTIQANGSFTYNPAVGFSGTDTFTYTAHSGTSMATETVTITVAGEIWFINNNAGACSANCNGRLSNPFISLAAFNAANLGGAGQPGDNDWIFVYESATVYTGPATLRLGQKLIGQDATASLISLTGFAPPSGTDPLPAMNSGNGTIVQITTSAAATNGINLNSGNTLRGFTVGNTTGAKISGTNFGTLLVGNSASPDVTLNGTGQALSLTTGTLSVAGRFVSVTTTSSTAQGISLAGVADSDGAGPGSFLFGSTTVSGSTTQGILIGTTTADLNLGNTAITGGTAGISFQNNSAGTRTIGTLNASGGSGNAFLHGAAGGNVTITGAATLSSANSAVNVSGPGATNAINFQAVTSATSTVAGNTGVTWTGVAGAVITFNSLTIQRNNATALNATGGGTVNVTNATGSINNTTSAGAAIVANGIALNANFLAINSTGGASGVSLTTVSGTSNFGTGALSGSTASTFLVSGGSASVTYSGNITQANNSPLVNVNSGHTTGTITFNTGTLSATNGTGLQFNNADSTAAYNFNGPTTLSGGNAGIDILAGSAGTFNFGTGVSITNPTGTGFVVNASTPSVTYSGNITKSGTSAGLLVDIQGQASGNITFQTGTLSSTSTTGTGIALNNADGTVNFNGTTTLNGGDAGVDIITGSAGTISFGANASITNPTNAAFTVNASTPGVTYSGNITKSGASAGLLVDIQGQASGTITFQTGTLSSTSSAGTGLSFNNTDGTVNFNGTTTLNGGDSAIDITNGSAGTFAFGGTTITNPSGIALNVDGATGGISISGALSKDSAGRLIDFNNYDTGAANISGALSCTALCDGIEVTNNGAASGTVNFSNASKVLNTSADTAVNLDNNDAGTINFTGGNLDIDTTTGVGFNAINGGTVTVQGANNSITSTTGTALNIANTNIGAADVTFQSISSSGGTAAGIILNTTGGSGGLHVTGTGSAGSGGTIANKTGGDIASGTAPGTWTGGTVGTALILIDTAEVQLDRMQLNDFTNYAIYARDVAGMSFTNSTISGTIGDSNAFDECAIFLRNSSGTITLTSVNISGGLETNLDILYDSATADTATYNVTSSVFTDLGTGNNAMVKLTSTTAASASSNVTFNFGNSSNPALGNTFDNSANQNPSPPPATQWFGDGILVTFEGPFQHTINIDNNTFFELFQGIDYAANFSADVNGRIYNNTITYTEGVGAIAFGTGSSSTSNMLFQMLIEDNDIGGLGNDSGSRLGSGIVGDFRGAEIARVTLHQNVVRDTEVNPINFINQATGDDDLHLRITNNTVASIDDDAGGGAGVIPGINVTTNAATNGDVFLTITGNDSSSINEAEILVRQATLNNTYSLEDFAGTGTVAAQVEAYLVAQNPGTTARVRTGGSVVNYTTMNFNNTNTPAPLTPLMAAPGGVEAFSSDSNSGEVNASLWPMFVTPNNVSSSLTQAELDALVTAAMERWSRTGLTANQTAAMRELRFEVGDLSDSYLGQAIGMRIVVDRNGGGKGWFIDATPANDLEFGDRPSVTRSYTRPFMSAAGRVDLLTAIEHEIGHRLGLDDSYAETDRDSIMYGYLTVGERRVPAKGQAANAQAGRLIGTHHLKLKENGRKAEGRNQKAETRNNHAATSRALTTPMSGETVTANIGSLPAGSSVTISYQVTVNNPPNLSLLSPPRVENQGTVTANGGINVLTDDPTVVGPADKTVTLINLFDTTTSLVSNLNPASQNEEVTFTATINETPTQGSADPTGTVDFIDTSNGNAVICDNVAVTGGQAQCLTSTLTAGTHNIRADYSGDGNFDPSQSNVVAQVVNACTTNPIVTSTADSGAGTLREAIANVCTGNTITFDLAGAGPHTITLTTGELAVTKNVTINNNSGESVTVSGNNASRVFNINSGKTASIIGLSMTGGSATDGGAIINDGVLTIVNSTLSGNTAANDGGAISTTATGTSLTLINTTLSGNTAAGSGGGLITLGGTVSIINTTITNNTADSDNNSLGSGGGIRVQAGTVTLKNTIVAGNFNEDGASDAADDISGTVDPTSSFNLIGTGGAGGLTNGVNGNQVGVASPGLGPLANNGGTTQTHALLATSPAIETGSNANLPADTFDLDGDSITIETLPVDQRGVGYPRRADSSDADGTQTVDIGAYELHPSLENITDKTTPEDTPFNFSFSIGDDSAPGVLDSVTATSSNTTLVTNANLDVTFSDGTANFTITPSTDANSPADGTATITVTVTAANGQTAMDTFVLTVTEVNDNPDAVNDSLAAINEDSGTRVIPFADLLGNDTRGPANESGQTITITNVSNPTGGTVVINGMTVEFTPTANFAGTASFDYTITDNGTTNGVLDAKSDTATASFSVVAVNDPPSFTGGANQTEDEDAGAQTVVGWATNISAGPGESQTLTFNVSVTGTTGNLAFTSAPAVDATTGTLTYTTAANTNGTANLSVTLSDDGSNTPPNSNTSPPQTFTITVNAVNDAPTFQLGANPSVGEDAGPQTINSFAFNFQPGPATATDEAGQTLVGYTLTQTGSTGGLTFSSAPAINTSGTLTFTSSAGLSGTATFDVVATDSGPGTPPNVNQSAPISFTITVNSINDPPVNTVPGPQSTNQNTPLVFSSGNGNQISVADADAGTSDIQVTLTANNGTLTLSGTTGLTFTVGGGTNDTTMTFTGTIANINTALNGMTFTPTTGFSGIAGVTITTNDQGNTGGPAESDTDSVTIQVLTNISIQDAMVAEPISGSRNMLFTVSLSAPASGAVSFDFATADQAPGPGHAVAGSDYTTTTGTVNFALGEQVKTIAVPVLSDSDSGEPDETFLVNLTNPSNGNIVDAQATGTITAANPPGTLIISELRTSGPGGAGDDFVEIYNNTNSPFTVPVGGYGLFKMGADCNAAPVLIGTIPAATVIPQRGHYLFVGSTYSLTAYAGGNATLTTDIESDFNVGLFMTVDPLQVSTTNRLDAVGFGNNTVGVCALLLEGPTLAPAQGNITDYSFVREFTLVSNDVPTPTDGNDNAADFTVISTTPGTPVGATAAPRLGAPGPENLAGPNLKKFAQVGSQFIDPMVSQSLAPNRARDTTPDPANNSTLGTIAVRRTFTNNTGGAITRLRFRIYDITTFPSPVGTADLRARTSSNAVVTVTGVGSVTALATTLETPPAQPSSGGLNASLAAGTVTMGTPLAAGASIHVNFLFGVQQGGSFRVFAIVEALP